MGGINIQVSELKPVSTITVLYIWPAIKTKQSISRALFWLSNATVPSHGWKRPVRRAIEIIRHSLFGYKPVAHLVKYDQLYLKTYFSDELGVALLNEVLDKPRLLSVPPLIPYKSGYLLVWWYHDGGSDGSEEVDDFSKKIEQYFKSKQSGGR
ncbi:hypothetical protein [Reinekea sp. G2M2-21]|uniref:hypothetical protein n=1 Tax=Reinekea sp. G2M2-21 TaxID=2788942 RepID=UPI0018A91648|nr:hypothetical protein [Reinekea sp. G2M2-21]